MFLKKQYAAEKFAVLKTKCLRKNRQFYRQNDCRKLPLFINIPHSCLFVLARVPKNSASSRLF
jgi:hypothetical protein